MPREAYPAARAVSPKLHAYFAGQAGGREGGSQERAAVPDTQTVESIIDAAFWASLRREEGYIPRISLAFLAPGHAKQALIFERPLAVDPAILTRVAPAVERAGIHLGVWHDPENGLAVWGAARGIPKFCFVVEVAAAGLIVIKNHSAERAGKFVNVAVLEGDQIKVVNPPAPSAPEDPSLLGFGSPVSWAYSADLLVQLAVSMRAHGHGGTLLVVPSESQSWRDSIVPPIPYALQPSFSGLAHLSHHDPDKAQRIIDAIAGLTAVDGALVMTDRYEVLGFGAKIMRRKGRAQVEQLRMVEPIEGGIAALVHPEQLGGTRHLSAAQFVQDQPEAAALVASQDQRFTVFQWSSRDQIVHAHRMEALLL